MPARRRIAPADGADAVRRWAALADERSGGPAPGELTEGDAPPGGPAPAGAGERDSASRPAGVDRRTTATAVRYTLEELAACAPGRSVEVRVPPFGVTQAVAGAVHRRGTPPAVVETDADTWLALATGRLSWHEAAASGALRASGERCDLSAYLPLLQA